MFRARLILLPGVIFSSLLSTHLVARKLELGLEMGPGAGTFQLERRFFNDDLFSFDGYAARTRVQSAWQTDSTILASAFSLVYEQNSGSGIAHLGLETAQRRMQHSQTAIGNQFVSFRQIKNNREQNTNITLAYLWPFLTEQVHIGPVLRLTYQDHKLSISENTIGQFIYNSIVAFRYETLSMNGSGGLHFRWQIANDWQLQSQYTITILNLYGEVSHSQFNIGNDRIYKEQASGTYKNILKTFQLNLNYSLTDHWTLSGGIKFINSKINYPGYFNLAMNLNSGAGGVDFLEILSDKLIYNQSQSQQEQYFLLKITYNQDLN